MEKNDEYGFALLDESNRIIFSSEYKCEEIRTSLEQSDAVIVNTLEELENSSITKLHFIRLTSSLIPVESGTVDLIKDKDDFKIPGNSSIFNI